MTAKSNKDYDKSKYLPEDKEKAILTITLIILIIALGGSLIYFILELPEMVTYWTHYIRNNTR